MQNEHKKLKNLIKNVLDYQYEFLLNYDYPDAGEFYRSLKELEVFFESIKNNLRKK